MESIVVIAILCVFSTIFVICIVNLAFRIDRNERAINKLIERRIFDEKIRNQKRRKDGRPVGSNMPTNLEIESYYT